MKNQNYIYFSSILSLQNLPPLTEDEIELMDMWNLIGFVEEGKSEHQRVLEDLQLLRPNFEIPPLSYNINPKFKVTILRKNKVKTTTYLRQDLHSDELLL